MILLLTFMAQWPKKDLTFNQGAKKKKKKKFHMLKILVWGGGATLTSLKIINCCMIQI